MTKLVNKNTRNVKIPCGECGKMLKFSIRNDVVVEGDGVIAVNFPGAACRDCIDSVLNQVSDPPGLICIKELSPILAREILMSFTFLRPKSEAVKFFVLLFPESGLGEIHINSNF
jgi:hypothetical protein